VGVAVVKFGKCSASLYFSFDKYFVNYRRAARRKACKSFM